MKGSIPLRRTLYYLKQGRLFIRDEVKVMIIGYSGNSSIEGNEGVKDFVFWHFSQLQYQNPHIQLVKYKDFKITPFVLAYLSNGKEVLFDIEKMKKDEIVRLLLQTLGTTNLVRRREHLESMQNKNPADFGIDCERQCLCEVQGQAPCTSLILAPTYMKGKWRWNLDH